MRIILALLAGVLAIVIQSQAVLAWRRWPPARKSAIDFDRDSSEEFEKQVGRKTIARFMATDPVAVSLTSTIEKLQAKAEPKLSPILEWFQCHGPGQHRPVHLRARDHKDAELVFKRWASINDAQYEVRVIGVENYRPSADDLANDKILYPNDSTA